MSAEGLSGAFSSNLPHSVACMKTLHKWESDAEPESHSIVRSPKPVPDTSRVFRTCGAPHASTPQGDRQPRWTPGVQLSVIARRYGPRTMVALHELTAHELVV